MESQKYTVSVQEFNKRLLKLASELYEITGNERFERFVEYVNNELEIGKSTSILYRFIQEAEPEHYARVAQGDRSIINTGTAHNIDLRILTELRNVFSDLHLSNQDVVFKYVQQIFKIASFVKENYLPELIRDSI